MRVSKVKAITSGMIRSLDTFGAGVPRDTPVVAETVTDPRSDRKNIRSDWEKVGRDIQESAKRLARRG